MADQTSKGELRKVIEEFPGREFLEEGLKAGCPRFALLLG